MNAAVAKRTQDTLGKVIKKPPLTEKLLSRPPFRYLHDIIGEVIRTTGFLKGLYTETEMKSDNVKDKDAKIAFLQKAIDVVMLVSGEPLAAKPARIVAGHEPEKTNELLQAIGKCGINKLNSEEAVRRVLSGEKVDLKGKASTSTSRSQDKENREGRDHHRDREEKKEIKDSSVTRAQKDTDKPKEQGSQQTEKERHRDTERSEKGRERDRTKDRDKDKSRDREKDKGREKDREKDREREKTRDRDRDKDRDREKRRDKDRERHKETEDQSREKSDQKVRSSEETQREEPGKNHKAVTEETLSPARIPRPSSAKGQRRWPKVGGQDESDSDGEAPAAEKLVNGDVTDTAPPHPAQRRIPRPGSARPAPPRVKRQESYTDVSPTERVGSAKPPSAVIMEGKKLSEDEEDDEQFVVEEAAPVPPDLADMEESPAELQGNEKHGALVKKILETKKDFESTQSPKSNQERALVSEAARKKERELVSREIERLRSSIQTVCCSALPLGKIMNYIQEDMDSMQNELQTWRRENREHAHALLQEQRITDSVVEPLKAELAELDQMIRDQQDKICAVKANVLKNEEKIQKMVFSINFSSQR
ncbi:TRAF3-interacting protein 1 isoform X2 [Denticeps clupeoides]|uniref:TRAF3-interacting protein 1 n=1 Tax=Denticeps clupeoides TaxID=299321 RepID=A0AAY4CHZ6_9TELE|nr:TRAF3-interacting protein 1 isoform X2 [Denticeps clupeoides]